MQAVNRASYDATYAAPPPPSFLPLPLSPIHPCLIVPAPATVSAATAATSLTLRIGKRDLMRFAFILKY